MTLTLSDGDTSAGCAGHAHGDDHLQRRRGRRVVTSAAFVPGSGNGAERRRRLLRRREGVRRRERQRQVQSSGERSTTTGASRTSSSPARRRPSSRTSGTSSVNTANGARTPRATCSVALSLAQTTEQGGRSSSAPLSTEVVRQMEANGTDCTRTEKTNLATRLGLTTAQVLADGNTLSGVAKTADLREGERADRTLSVRHHQARRSQRPLPRRARGAGRRSRAHRTFGSDPGDGDDARDPRPDHVQAGRASRLQRGRSPPLRSHLHRDAGKQVHAGDSELRAFAPKINAYIQAGNFVSSYYATGNPSRPNYTALGGADDFGITDDSQWNCDATGANAVQDLPVPDKTQPGLGASPFTATCTQSSHVNHNITAKPNLFNAINARRGMTWRTYNESMNPGQDIRTDSVADNAITVPDHVYAPGTAGNNAATVGNPSLILPLPAGLYKTKHHPGMAYQNVRSEADFKYSNRTLGGGQWDSVLLNSALYAVPPGYDLDQFGTDLGNGGIGTLNFVVPDQCDDMHGVTLQGSVPPSTTKFNASDCCMSIDGNNQPVATKVATIITRGDNYVDYLSRRRSRPPRRCGRTSEKKVAIVLMFDEGNASGSLRSTPAAAGRRASR